MTFAPSARDELTRIIDAEQVPLSAEERTRLVRDVADDVLGYGPLQRLLDDPAVTEIMVNRMDQIYVERHGQLTLTESRFSSEDHLRKVIERIVSKVGRRIDESSPAGGRPARGRLPRQRRHPAARRRRLFADHPKVQQGAADGPEPHRLRHAHPGDGGTAATPASRPSSTSSSPAAPAPARRRC